MAIAAFVLAIGGGSVRAADDVVIGALYPMTGPNAQVGNDAKAAMETAAEIINGKHDVPMLLGKGGGLDRLGGARLRLIFADHQGDPQKARAEAERLITQEHVAALIGSYQSATAATISQVRLFNTHPTGKALKRERLAALMGDGGIQECGYAQNCVEVCPKDIPLTKSISEVGGQVMQQALGDLLRR